MNNTNYFAKVAQQNKLNELSDILKDIEINQSLLAQIKNYMQEVKANPECGKYWYVKLYDVGEIGFYIQNNTIQYK
ncbi:MAG: hypothetical protein IKU01_05220 [Bacteroidales bacterium]|nr:hypothetical protein [Bacteroidales bacterium]